MEAQGKLFVAEGPLCPRCPWRGACGAMFGDKACRAKWKAKAWGGRQALHPSFRITTEFLDSVGGPSFDDVVAGPVQMSGLADYISLIRIRRALKGQLHRSVYGITAGQVIGTRSKPLTSQAVREMVGLEDHQALILFLFGKDEYLEHLWNQRNQFLPELAEAGFDLIVAPSYSLWEPRPRPEHLYALKRSLVVFQTLQELGAPAIPRVAWSISHDAERLARWANANPALSHVGIDLTTYRGVRGYAKQLDLLRRFDCLSGVRLSYLVNGPSTLDRIQALYEAVSPGRVHIANSRAIARDSAPGTTYLEKEETDGMVIDAAHSVVLTNALPTSPRPTLQTHRTG